MLQFENLTKWSQKVSNTPFSSSQNRVKERKKKKCMEITK